MNDETVQPPVDLPGQPFFSFGELRAAHTTLLQRQQTHNAADLFAQDVALFIRRGRATGALLAERSDRRAAQSLLDYWLTGFYRLDQEPPDATLLDFDPEQAPHLPDTACPYVGLEAFREENTHLFFGRQRLIAEMIEHLKTNPLLVVVGPSGSGKSSLVRAGLLPALKAGTLADSSGWHYCRPVVPGTDPMMALARLTRPPRVGTSTWRAAQVQHFREDASTLTTLLENMASTPSVVVVDQFEELFTLCDDVQVQQAFVANLLHLIQSSSFRHVFILTMRSDFEPLVTRLESFYPWFKAARVAVPPLDASELRDAILQPAETVGLTFETGVVDALLYDLLGEPAALPLLQVSLLKLWEERERNRVTMTTYRQIGGGRTALANSADAFYTQLFPEEQVTARRILLRMVRPGDGLEVTSRRIRLRDLNAAQEDPDRMRRVLAKLIDARLVHRTTGDTDDEADVQLEVAHEALIRNWPRLVDWLEDERALLRQRMRLTHAAEQWERLEREPTALLRGTLLNEVLRDKQWISALNRLERSYVTASLLAEEEAKRREAEQYQQARDLAEERARRAEAEHQRAAAEVRRLEAEQQHAQEQARAEAQARVAQRMRMLIIVLFAITALALLIAAVAVGQHGTIVTQEGRIQNLHETGTIVAVQVVSAQADARSAIAAADATQVVVRETNVALDRTQQSVQRTATQLVIEQSTAEQQSTDVAVAAIAAQQTSTALAQAAALSEQTGVALATNAEAQRVTATALADWEKDNERREQQNRAWSLVRESLGADDPRIALEKAVEAASSSTDLFVEDALQLAIQRSITPVKHGSYATSATWSPDGQYVLTTGQDNTARIWRTTDVAPFLQEATTLSGHRGTVISVAWSHTGQYIVTGSRDGTVKLWWGSDWQEERTLFEQSTAIYGVAWSPDDILLATSDAQTIKIWNAADGSRITTIRSPGQQLTDAAWSGDGNYVVTTDGNGSARIWNIRNGEMLSTLPAPHGAAYRATWRGADILTAGTDGITRLWNAGNVFDVREKHAFIRHERAVHFATWHCNDYILTVSEDGTARIWRNEDNAQSLAILQSAPANTPPLIMANTNSDCTRTVTADDSGAIRIYYVRFDKILATAQDLLRN